MSTGISAGDTDQNQAWQVAEENLKQLWVERREDGVIHGLLQEQQTLCYDV